MAQFVPFEHLLIRVSRVRAPGGALKALFLMTMSIGDGVFLSVFDNLKCNHSIKSLPVLLKPSIFLVHIYLLKMKYFFKNIETLEMVCYNFCVAHRYPATGGGDFMSIFISFLVTVAAGVACHYIIKWLDSNDKGNK